MDFNGLMTTTRKSQQAKGVGGPSTEPQQMPVQPIP